MAAPDLPLLGDSNGGDAQLALSLEPHEAPALREMTPWERLLADYGSTHITLREHPLELCAPRSARVCSRAPSSSARLTGAK